MTTVPFQHVLAMSDHIGMFEHADHTEPRISHGYCTDDVARLLIVLVREGDLDGPLRTLTRTAFRFLTEGQSASGRLRNRRDAQGRWQGRAGVEDCWGRSVWAFGTAAARADADWLRAAALSSFRHGAQERSPHRRAMAFAALGAAEVLRADPRDYSARELLADVIDSIGPLSTERDWPLPEPRLTYANAAVAEALIAAGDLLRRPSVVDDGLMLLRWLVERETFEGHLSPTPVGGAGPADRPPMFDQQPIEVAALADACARALAVTGDDWWRHGLDSAIAWFGGANDCGTPMYDPETGAGFDGLTPLGPNLNQGAESTLAMISTLQHGRTPSEPRQAQPAAFRWSAG